VPPEFCSCSQSPFTRGLGPSQVRLKSGSQSCSTFESSSIMAIVYGVVLLLNILLISSSGATQFKMMNGTHGPLFMGPGTGSSSAASLASNGYQYPSPAMLSLNSSASDSEPHPASSQGPTLFLNSTAMSNSNSLPHTQETSSSGLTSTQSIVSHIMKRGILSTLFGVSSNTSNATEAVPESSSSPASVSTGGSDIIGQMNALSKNHRNRRGAYSSRRGQNIGAQTYARPQYYPSSSVYEKTTSTTPSPPRNVLICIIDGKVVELDDEWKSCPQTTTTTTTTTVAHKDHHLEHKPLELQTLKPLDAVFKLPNLLHH